MQSFLWDGASIRDLGIPLSNASGVNNCGVVVGDVMTNVRETRGFSWHEDQWFLLPTLGDPMLSSAAALNNDGVIVGWASGPEGVHAVSWTPSGAIRDLAPGTNYSQAFAIAPNGAIVGSLQTLDSSHRTPVRFNDGTPEPLAPEYDGAALAVNAAGAVVGSAWFGSEEHGVVYSNETVTDVGILSGMTGTRLVAVNASGVAVGSAFGADKWPFSSRGIVYVQGQLLDLNALIESSEWFIVDARGIANDGTIAAWGVRTASLEPGSAIVLRPVDETALALPKCSAAAPRG